MSRAFARLAAALALVAGAPAMAHAEGPGPASPSADAAAQAVGVDVLTTSDSDHTAVSKLGLSFDWRRSGLDQYDGVRLEAARFRPAGHDATKDLRVFYRFADKTPRWAWNGQIGTDGDTVIGAFDVHNGARWRQEYFLERDIVETAQGLDRRLYYTFAGGALDLPLGDRDSFTVLGALQDFTGRNIREHVRVNYIHVLQPQWGLTAQVRARYFHSSMPGEFDYFSPRDFVQVVPTLQLRRRLGGWRYLLAAGLGGQKHTGAGWSQARAVSARITSPPVNRAWAFDAAFEYSNTPNGAGATYEYRQFSVGLRRAF